jgi:catecholate siderophore receptor
MPTNAFIVAVARRPQTRRVLDAAALCLTGAAAVNTAMAQTDQVADASETITVTGLKDQPETGLGKLPESIQDTPQSIDAVSDKVMREERVTRLQDALRYLPGVTMNSGEGGAHGDTVNLRGLTSNDNFFRDGIRDPGSYSRDNFDVATVEILEGPSSVLFGNGSAGGAVNEVTKTPTLAPQRSVSLEFGTNDEQRGTLDFNQPIGESAAIRLDMMGEHSGVAGRDDVENKRWGFAPSIAIGLREDTTFTLSYFHQEENNIPDYGIPFIFGAPAPVPRNLYYGLKDSDVSQTDVNIMNAVIEHQFSDALSISDTVRYANYWTNYRVTGAFFGNDFSGGPPDPGTPLDQIFVSRDRPSSEGTATYLTNHTDLTARFSVGAVSNLVVAGFELGRQTNDLVRFNNDSEGLDAIAPTPLLAPDANEPAPLQVDIDSMPSTTADTIGVYALDTVQFTPQWSMNLGIRFDRYDTQFDEPLSVSHFERIDTKWSPRASISYKPTDTANFYFSYATSFDPPVSYLTLAPDSKGPAPETAKTYEVGAKTTWLGGLMNADVALFRTDTSNLLVSDPDDPTLQEMAGKEQEVQGIEVSLTGHLTPDWELDANITLLDPKITSSTDPAELGRQLPGVAHTNANLWTSYQVTDEWQVGTGINYLGHRFADVDNTAGIPGYVVWNAMVAWQATDDLRVQLSGRNLTDKYYYDGAYYSGADENHVIPGAGRTVTLGLNYDF